MAIINFANREITAKIVYFGMVGAGGTTNLRRLHELVPAREKSRLHPFGSGSEDERSLYFDFVPPEGGSISGFETRFRVYSLRCTASNAAERAEVFRGTDAIVFVADARRTRTKANIETLLVLESALNDQGLDLANLPLVFQVNHIDAADAETPEQVVYDLNPYGFPVTASVAREGKGVLETLDAIVSETVSRIRDNLSGADTAITLTAVHSADVTRDEDVIARHLAALTRAVENTEEVSVAPAPRVVDLRRQRPDLTLSMPYHIEQLTGWRPLEAIETAVSEDEIRVDVIMASRGDAAPKRIRIVLSEQQDSASPATVTTNATAARLANRDDDVTGHLPDAIPLEINTREPDEVLAANDARVVIYGVAGLVGGLTGGFLLAFLLYS